MFAFFNLGPQELLILLIIALFYLLVIWPAWKVCVKAGFPGPLSLVVLLPGGILVLLFVLAFIEWPALRHAVNVRELGP